MLKGKFNLITFIQISTCHRCTSISFKDRETMETFSKEEHFITETINPFYSNVTFLYPQKTSENLWFSDVFRGYRNVTLD